MRLSTIAAPIQPTVTAPSIPAAPAAAPLEAARTVAAIDSRYPLDDGDSWVLRVYPAYERQYAGGEYKDVPQGGRIEYAGGNYRVVPAGGGLEYAGGAYRVHPAGGGVEYAGGNYRVYPGGGSVEYAGGNYRVIPAGGSLEYAGGKYRVVPAGGRMEYAAGEYRVYMPANVDALTRLIVESQNRD